jgi:hypothetical protein
MFIFYLYKYTGHSFPFIKKHEFIYVLLKASNYFSANNIGSLSNFQQL